MGRLLSLRHRAAYVVAACIGTAVLSACTPAPGESAGAQTPIPMQAAERVPGQPSQSGDPVLPAELDSCLPPTYAGPWVETGRATDGNATYVMVEPSDEGATAGFNPVVARLADGACESYLMYVTDAGSDTDVAPPSLDAMNQMLDGSFAWHVAQSGGAQAYADVQREFNGGVLNECSPDDDIGPCIATWIALRLRESGVEVGADS